MNEELLVEIAKSKKLGKPTDRFGKLVVKIAERMLKRKGFVSLTPYDITQDMLHEAVFNMLRLYANFKPEKDDNAYSYLTTITRSSFIKVIHQEKKETQTIIDYGNSKHDENM